MLTIKTEGLRPEEVRSVEEAIERAQLGREIRREFDRLKPKLGWEKTIKRLAKEYPVSKRTVRRIIYGY